MKNVGWPPGLPFFARRRRDAFRSHLAATRCPGTQHSSWSSTVLEPCIGCSIARNGDGEEQGHQCVSAAMSTEMKARSRSDDDIKCDTHPDLSKSEMSEIGDDIVNLARDASRLEQTMTLRQGLKLYPAAIAWSVMLSTAIIMEGYGELELGWVWKRFVRRGMTAEGQCLVAHTQTLSSSVHSMPILNSSENMARDLQTDRQSRRKRNLFSKLPSDLLARAVVEQQLQHLACVASWSI